MKNRTGPSLQSLMFAVDRDISAVTNFRLTDFVPTHWNIHNQAYKH